VPRQAIIGFLESGEGLAFAIVVYTAIALGAFIAFFAWLRRAERSSTPDDGPAAGDLGRAIASLLAVACLVLPVVFTIASGDVFAWPKTAALWILAVTIAILVAVALTRDRRRRRVDSLTVAVLAFAGLTALATVLSIDPGHSLVGERLQYQGLVTTLAYVVFFIAARMSIVSVRRAQVVAAGLLASGTVAALYAFAQATSLDPIWSGLYKDRVFSTMGQASNLAAVLGMSTMVALTVAAGRRRGAVAAVLLAALLNASALVLTLTRGAYVGLVAGGIVAGLVLGARRTRKTAPIRLPRAAIAVVGGIALIVAVVIVWQPASALADDVAERALSIPAVTESSNRSKLDMWEVGLRIAAENPLIGIGPDSYVLLFGAYRDRVLTPDRAAVMARFRPESPHNVYIANAANTGVPALVAYVALVVLTLAVGLRAARQDIPRAARLALAGLIGAIAVHLVTDAFMTAEPAGSAIFWILLGAVAGVGGRFAEGENVPVLSGTGPTDIATLL
jgi:putative inorganic carbon (hco3(-)) transporter